MYEVKERKYIAPEGYLYHKDGRYVDIVYPTARQSIGEYELVAIEEYQSIVDSPEAVIEDYQEALNELGVNI